MKKLQFSQLIDAAPQDVYRIMLAPDTYREWTSAFTEGSYFEGSWAQGERILFLAPSGDGMVAVIDENRPNEFVSIRHLGMIKDGVEDTESEEVRRWTPAFENYSFEPAGSATRVSVSMDVMPDFEQCMVDVWPKALDKLKEICESSARAVP